ncbi:nitrite extrusion protein [Mycobacterium tuberculosis T85]|nr:nitrite extrusion protein [Mycobacterium tuberculosis T85]
MRGQAANLVLATWISVVNFWAWNLIGPLSTSYARDMSLSSAEASLLVATPILVGALGRIVTGPLTDRFGGRAMLIAVTLASILPVLAVGVAATMGSYALLVFFGLFLGVAGTIFAVGIPFANNWYQPARRGFSTGVFGMGMVGTALSAFFTPRFVRWFGLFTTHAIVAAALASTAVVAMVVLRDAPYFRPNADPVLPRLKAAARLPVTWEMSFLYAIVFGGFVAFSNYLPTYITTIYGFSTVDAGARTAGFALAGGAGPAGGRVALRPDRTEATWCWPRSPGPRCWRSPRRCSRRRRCGRRPPSSPWRSASAWAPAACSRGWPAAPRPHRSARSPESSPRQADWAVTSRRW